MDTTCSTSKRKFLLAHTSPVTSLTSAKPGLCLSGSQDNVAYGHLGDLCASGSRDKNVLVWTTTADKKEMLLEGHKLPVMGLDFSPDCKRLCTGSRDNSIKMWDLISGHQIAEEIISRNLVTHLRWSKLSDFLVQTSEDKQLRLWDTRILRVVHTFAKQQHIQTYCDISSDENYVLTCTGGSNGNGCDIQLWDMRLREQINVYRGHERLVTGCLFLSPITTGLTTCNQIASVSQDETIRLWNQEQGDCLTVEKLPMSGTLADIQDFGDKSLGVATHNFGIRRYLRGIRHTGETFLKHVSTF